MKTRATGHQMGLASIAVGERFDDLEASSFEDAVSEHLHLGNTRIVADLSLVQTIGPRGLDALISAQRDTEAAGGGLRLVTPCTPDAVQVLYLSGFDEEAGLSPTLSHALEQW